MNELEDPKTATWSVIKFLALLALGVLIIGFALSASAATQNLTASWTPPASDSYTCTGAPVKQIGYVLYQVDMYNGKVLQIGISGYGTTSQTVTVDSAHWYLFYMRSSYADDVLSQPSNIVQYDGAQATVVITQTKTPICP